MILSGLLVWRAALKIIIRHCRALDRGGQSVGVLTLAHHTVGRYGHEAQAMTTTFASYAAAAIENARLYDAAQEQAYASAALLAGSASSSQLERPR